MTEIIVCAPMQALPCPVHEETKPQEEKPIEEQLEEELLEETEEEEPTETPKTETPIPEKPKIATFKTTEPKMFKDIFGLVNVLSDEATFNANSEGLTLKLMDPSRVAMIKLFLARHDFYEFECMEPFRFCFNTEDFSNGAKGRIFKNLHKDETASFTVNTETAKITTELQSANLRKFTRPLLEPSSEELPDPKITHNYTARLVLAQVNDIFKDVDQDAIIFAATQDSLKLNANSDMGQFETTIKIGSDTMLKCECKENSRAVISTSYLKEILAAMHKVSEIINIHLSTDMPIRLSAQILHESTVDVWIAPRIETE